MRYTYSLEVALRHSPEAKWPWPRR